jgi:hypothetical protein
LQPLQKAFCACETVSMIFGDGTVTKLRLADTMGLRFDGKHLLDIKCTNEEGLAVYPYLLEKRGAKGEPVFDVKIPGITTNYEGFDLSQLLTLFKVGVFNRGAQLRMKPLARSESGAQAPELGTISAHFRSLVAALDAPKPAPETVSTVEDIDAPASALKDLATGGDEESGDRALAIRHVYRRDPQVRRRVLEFANGICEYCGKTGFLKLNGERYLETHHVISLSDNGDDSVENVIAVCPEHHREAHFGANGEALERDFIKVIGRRRGKL